MLQYLLATILENAISFAKVHVGQVTRAMRLL